jgi:hypothetical protein
VSRNVAALASDAVGQITSSGELGSNIAGPGGRFGSWPDILVEQHNDSAMNIAAPQHIRVPMQTARNRSFKAALPRENQAVDSKATTIEYP